MIPRDQIDEIVQANDIVEVISEYIELQRRGSNFMGRCPFHNEKTPSFSVNREKNIFHCFGCHEHGNAIGFIMKYDNLTYVEAIEKLAKRVGITLKDDLNPQDKTKENLYKIYEIAGKYFEDSLNTESANFAREYAKARGLTFDTIEKFQIGYAPSNSKLYEILKKNNFSDDIIVKSGLFTFYDNNIRDKFFNRLMFPIFDLNSRIVAFGGRNLSSKGAKYLNSPETEIFKKSKIIYGLNFAKKRRPKYLILCEGYIDVVMMHRYGFDMTVATLGTACNENHLFELKKVSENIFVLYDFDEAGINAAQKATMLMAKNNIAVRVVTLNNTDIKNSKDPDEILRYKGWREMLELIKNAKYGYEFCIECESKKFNLLNPNDKAKFAKNVAQILAIYPKEVIVNSYEDIAENISLTYKIDKNLLIENIRFSEGIIEKRVDIDEKELQVKKEKNLTENKIEQAAISILLNKKFYDATRKYIEEDYFSSDLRKKMLIEIDEIYKKGNDIPQAILIAHFEDISDQEKVAKAFRDCENLMARTESECITALTDIIIRLIENSYKKKNLDLEDPTTRINNLKERKNKLANIDIRID